MEIEIDPGGVSGCAVEVGRGGKGGWGRIR